MIENRWRKKAKPAKLGRRRRRLFYIKVASAALALILLMTGTVFLSRASGLQVKDFAVSTDNSALRADIVTLAGSYGQGHYLFVLPKTNIALYPRQALASAILSDFPQIKSADVSDDGLTKLSINISERTPVGLWCGRHVPEVGSTENDCYFLDEGGYIYGKAPGFSGPVFVRFYGLDSEGEPLRAQYLPNTTFRTLELFFTRLRSLGLTVNAFIVKDQYDYELDSAEGPYLLFSRKDDLDTVLQNIGSVVDSDALRGKVGKLQYLDLRFGNKVYYKEK